MCNGYDEHDFIVAYVARAGMGDEEVVRWCRQCGAISVDVDVDNRVFAGRVKPLRLPHNQKIRNQTT